MKADWTTYSPFQSPDVREICAHMSGSELSALSRRAGLYGVWVAMTFGVPLGFAITYRSRMLVEAAVILVAVHLACVPIWQGMQRRFLCSTAWAQERGFAAERLRLFSFRSHAQ